MKRLHEAFARWKAKHWDKSVYSYDGGSFGMLGFNSPPLRAFWEKHGERIKKLGMWLLALIAGGVITKLVGLA